MRNTSFRLFFGFADDNPALFFLCTNAAKLTQRNSFEHERSGRLQRWRNEKNSHTENRNTMDKQRREGEFINKSLVANQLCKKQDEI